MEPAEIRERSTWPALPQFVPSMLPVIGYFGKKAERHQEKKGGTVFHCQKGKKKVIIWRTHLLFAWKAAIRRSLLVRPKFSQQAILFSLCCFVLVCSASPVRINTRLPLPPLSLYIIHQRCVHFALLKHRAVQGSPLTLVSAVPFSDI